MTTLAVTGHRPDKAHQFDPWSQASHTRLREFARGELRRLQPSRVITGMALGFDLAIADACALDGIPFVAAVPCDNQERKWTPYWQSTYQFLLANAAEVHVVSPGPYQGWKMLRRNVWMLEQLGPGDKLLALWDGSSGGTGHCCKSAENMQITMENCWERWKEFRGLC